MSDSQGREAVLLSGVQALGHYRARGYLGLGARRGVEGLLEGEEGRGSLGRVLLGAFADSCGVPGAPPRACAWTPSERAVIATPEGSLQAVLP